MRVLQCNPAANCRKQREALLDACKRVFDGGQYILGGEVTAFEREFAAFCRTEGALGAGSGTDALELILRSLDLPAGAGVAVPDLTASATAAAVQRAGLKAVLVDIELERFGMDPEALEETLRNRKEIRAVIGVHLYGLSADLQRLTEICRNWNLPFIEDCAQAHGAEWKGRKVGSIGIAGAFSFYPTKNLGAIGDGGMVVCSDSSRLRRLGALRQYGWYSRFDSDECGVNSRLDELQAAVLRVKLPMLETENERRRAIAAWYRRELASTPLLMPLEFSDSLPVYHQYVVRSARRDDLKAYLERNEIFCAVHYPKALHRQRAFGEGICLPLLRSEKAVSEILSLPMYPELTDSMVEYVVEKIKKFY